MPPISLKMKGKGGKRERERAEEKKGLEIPIIVILPT